MSGRSLLTLLVLFALGLTMAMTSRSDRSFGTGRASAATGNDNAGSPGSGVSDQTHTAPPRLVGCSAPSPGLAYAGNIRERRIALTFDDGPDPPYTERVMSVLERERVPATFFLIGRQLAADAELVRRELRDGFLLGDHTWSHRNVSSASSADRAEIRDTRNEIERVTGFQTCLMRPPYGATSPALVRFNAGLGLDTVNWNVDSTDWSRPGTATIVRLIMKETRPGSIILMHDGGGNRSETVAALPTVIHRLRAKGYQFVSLVKLLHLRLNYHSP